MQCYHGGGHSSLVVLRGAEGLKHLLHSIGDVRLVNSSSDKELTHLDGVQGKFLGYCLQAHVVLVKSRGSVHLVRQILLRAVLRLGWLAAGAMCFIHKVFLHFRHKLYNGL